MARLFVAIDVPPEVRAQLVGCKRPIAGARWVPEDQIHLTLRFIGDADEAAQRAIEAELAKVRARAFELAIDAVGQFPANRSARVLWAGVKPIEALVSLAKQVEEAVVAAGLEPETRAFSPHVTLARMKEVQKVPVKRFLEEAAALKSAPFAITEVLLYSSLLSPKGATHRVEKRFPLVPAS
jgi:RNA 2',3'-cyclic 3'-phosphodiesterase